MIREYKVVVVVPSGRQRYLEVLIPNIFKQKGWDELHFWKNTVETNDVDFINSLVKLDSRIKVIESPGYSKLGTNTAIYQFFEYCVDPKTVYIRFDDDICWIEDGLIEWLADLRWKEKEYFLVSPLIINNAVMTHLLQTKKNIKLKDDREVALKCMDPVGWQCPKFACSLHEFFLDKLKNKDIDSLKFHAYPTNHRYSINCISWLGSEFAKFNGQVGRDEENWLTVDKPRELKKQNLIYGGKICTHFSFYTQRGYLDTTDILNRYKLFT